MSKQYNKPPEYLIKEYNKLAKKADRRMRELERFSRYKEYEDIKEYAYKVAKHDIKKWTPPGLEDKAPRWQRNEPLDTRSLKAKIADIKKFLNMKTSTVTGVKKVYENRATALNKIAKENDKADEPGFTWQELANFFDMGLFDKTKNTYGSSTVLIAIGVMKKNHEEIAKQIRKKASDNMQITGDIKIDEAINGMLKNNKKDLKKLLDKEVI